MLTNRRSEMRRVFKSLELSFLKMFHFLFSKTKNYVELGGRYVDFDPILQGYLRLTVKRHDD